MISLKSLKNKMSRIVDFFAPERGVPITVSGLFFGWIPGKLMIGNMLLTRHDIIEYLQIAAFGVAILSGLLTAYQIIRKEFFKRKQKTDEKL